MEGLNTPKKNSSESGVKVDVFRHGKSGYTQPEWNDIETADDINTVGKYFESKTQEEIEESKQEAIAIVKASALELAKTIEPDEEVAIWSSPTGRTLETARIISETLQGKGIPIRNKGGEDYGVKIFEHIGEVKNFSWDMFEPMMEGKKGFNYKGKIFDIDINLSNPNKLGYPEYFTSDAIHNISQEVKDTWSKEYVDLVESFETFKDTTSRMKANLERLSKLEDKKYRVIMVTHDALTGALVKTFTSGEKEGVTEGQFVSLERIDNTLVVTRAGDIKEGDSKTDVLL